MKPTTEFKTAAVHPELENVMNIDANELASKMVPGAAALADAPLMLLIDVRMPQEYTGELGHIKGTKLIPLPTLPDHLSELPKDATIVFICKSGGRSAQASAFAHSHGFEQTFNLKGGMLQWNEQRLPVEL